MPLVSLENLAREAQVRELARASALLATSEENFRELMALNTVTLMSATALYEPDEAQAMMQAYDGGLSIFNCHAWVFNYRLRAPQMHQDLFMSEVKWERPESRKQRLVDWGWLDVKTPLPGDLIIYGYRVQESLPYVEFGAWAHSALVTVDGRAESKAGEGPVIVHDIDRPAISHGDCYRFMRRVNPLVPKRVQGRVYLRGSEVDKNYVADAFARLPPGAEPLMAILVKKLDDDPSWMRRVGERGEPLLHVRGKPLSYSIAAGWKLPLL